MLEFHSAMFEHCAKSKKICCIGAGYVGVPSMVVMAVECPEFDISVVDISEARIRAWSEGCEPSDFPFYEPGLCDDIKKCRGRNLSFSTDLGPSIDNADIIFVCVNTPTKTRGLGAGRAVDLDPWESAGRAIARYATRPKIIVEKSTVPVRTAEALESVLKRNSTQEFVIISNPEFMAEGTAMADLRFPNRVLLGGPRTVEGSAAIELLSSIYRQWVPKEKIIVTNLWSSELSKIVANAFLAQRVSSINAVALICERTGADVEEVACAVGMDSRIGREFLNASVGFGGSCFKKDILNLVYLCETFGLHRVGEYWNQILVLNDLRINSFASEILFSMSGTVTGKAIAIFGFSFKKNTSDTRESPAISICSALAKEGASLRIFDPCVREAQIYQDLVQCNADTRIEVCKSPESAAFGAQAIAVLTEWDLFKTLDFNALYSSMMKPAYVFDGRNVLDHHKLMHIGFTVKAVGKCFTPLSRNSN
jgi:UDPglucose 6-dehydrogenase